MKKIFLRTCLLFSSMMIYSCQSSSPCLNSVSTLKEISLSAEKEISLQLACKVSLHEVISVSIHQNGKFVTYETKNDDDNPLSIIFHFDGGLSKQEGIIPGAAILIISRSPAEENQDILNSAEILSEIKITI